jgi:hypothetical protein
MAEPRGHDGSGQTRSRDDLGEALDDGLAVAFGPAVGAAEDRGVPSTLNETGADPPREAEHDAGPPPAGPGSTKEENEAPTVEPPQRRLELALPPLAERGERFKILGRIAGGG